MIIYIVTANDKISSAGYKTLEEAQEFVKSRLAHDETTLQLVSEMVGYYSIVDNKGVRYRIQDVTVDN